MQMKNKQKIVNDIAWAANRYEESLNNCHFMIIFQKNSSHHVVEIGFRDMHFKHLTGVVSSISAQRFYQQCLAGKLSLKDFEVSKDGKTEQKLSVLPYLHELLYHNCMIGDFLNSGIRIRADYFVGDTRKVLSLGFRRGSNIDYPVTLYKEDVKRLSRPVYKVLAIFKKKYNQPEYTECTFLSKNQKIKSLKIPKHIKINEQLIKNEA